LGVLDPSGGAAVLALDGDRSGALLEEAGLVHDQNRVGVTQVLDDQSLQVVAHGLGIPDDLAQQPLHPRRSAVTGVLGQPPAVLTLDRRHQAE
jgi:hypothetical protein